MENDTKFYLPVSVAIKSSEATAEKSETASERQITFVASSTKVDRAQEIVQIDSFYLPLKGGDKIRVSELPNLGEAKLDVPLLANHDGWDIDSVLGSVRKATYDTEHGELVFTAGISSRQKAQELLTLIEEKHLDNAFSIGWRGGAYNPNTKTYTDGEVLEVSLVTRGCNRDARMIEVKSNNQLITKEQTMPQAETTQENIKQETDATADATPDTAATEDNNSTNETEKSMPTTDHKQLAASQVVAPSQKLTVTSNAKAYLDTDEANADFAKFIAENYGKSNAAVIKAWADKMAEKGITGDAFLPTTIEQTFFKVWTSDRGILAHMKHAKALQGSVYGFYADGRAAGHKKGEKKDNVGMETVRRDYKAKIAFAKMPIDLQDLVDDTTGELTLLRGEMLSDLLYNEIVRAIIATDGREEPASGAKDLRMFDGVRGLWSMLADIKKSATSGTDSATKFAKAVATKIANTASDNAYDKAVKTLSALKGKGEKVLIAPEGFISGLMLEKDKDGRYIFAPGSNFAQLLTAKVYEFDFVADSGMDLIAFNDGAYLLPMGQDMLRSAFDNDYNQDVLLHEKPVAGSLFGRKVCAGYASASTSTGTGTSGSSSNDDENK